jgi:hypothetical protein
MGDVAGEVKFRQPFWRWYLLAVVAGQVLFPLLNLIPAVTAPQTFGWAYFRATSPFGAALIPVFMAPAMFFYVRAFPVRVSPKLLRGANAWGWPVSVSWRSIQRVKSYAVPGFPLARVFSTETHRVLWLPLFLNDFPRFAELVAQYAGDGHPLTIEVRKRITDE